MNFPLSVASTTKMANHLNYNTGKHINDIAKLDSGATNHYLKPTHIKLLTHIETPKSQHESLQMSDLLFTNNKNRNC